MLKNNWEMLLFDLIEAVWNESFPNPPRNFTFSELTFSDSCLMMLFSN